MNLQERLNAIGTVLKISVLPRYRRPEHLDEAQARAELADMVADLNAEWPVTSADGFREIAERFAKELRKVATSRTWPSIATMLKALEAAKGDPDDARGSRKNNDPELLYAHVRTHWTMCQAALKSALPDGNDFAERMVRDGAATWGALEWHGFPLTPEQKAIGERENRQRYDDLMDALHRDTAHLRAHDAPKGDLRSFA